MAITRSSHSVKLEVDGARKAEQDLKAVDAADKKLVSSLKEVSESSNKAGNSLADVSAKASSSTGGLSKLTGTFEAVTGAAGKTMGALNGLGDVFKLVGLGFGAGALFGGLQDIVETMSILRDKFVLATTSLKDMSDATVLVNEKMLAAKLGVESVSDGLDRYARSMGLADEKALSFLQHQEALRSIASGATRDVDVERRKTAVEAKKLEELLYKLKVARAAGTPEEELSSLIREIRRQGDITAAQDMTERELKSDVAAASKSTLDFFRKAEEGRLATLKKAVEDAKASSKEAKRLREEYDKEYMTWMTPNESQRAITRRMMDQADRRAQERGMTAIQFGGGWMVTGMPQEQKLLKGPRAISDSVALTQQAETLKMEVRSLASLDALAKKELENKFTIASLGNDKDSLAMAKGELYSLKNKETVVPSWGNSTSDLGLMKTEEMAKSMQSGAGKIGAAFMSIADPVSAGLGMVTGAVTELSAALGTSLTNMFLSGESSQKSAKKIAGEMTAGLSAQAFSYSILFGAMAAAFALAPPPFNAYAATAGIGAGIMAGAGVALAVTARSLGAEPVGGAAGKKGSSGGGRVAGSDFQSLAPKDPSTKQPLEVTVILSDEGMYDRMVRVEQNRSSSGSLARPRLAGAV